jgi:hypothetical protein
MTRLSHIQASGNGDRRRRPQHNDPWVGDQREAHPVCGARAKADFNRSPTSLVA